MAKKKKKDWDDIDPKHRSKMVNDFMDKTVSTPNQIAELDKMQGKPLKTEELFDIYTKTAEMGSGSHLAEDFADDPYANKKLAKYNALKGLREAKQWELAGAKPKSMPRNQSGVFSKVTKFPPFTFKETRPIPEDWKHANNPEAKLMFDTDLDRQGINSEFLNKQGIETVPITVAETKAGGKRTIQPLILTVDDAVKSGDLTKKEAAKAMEELEQRLTSKGINITDLNMHNVAYDTLDETVKPFDVAQMADKDFNFYKAGEGGLSEAAESTSKQNKLLSESHKIAAQTAKTSMAKSAKMRALSALSKGSKVIPFLGQVIGAGAYLGGSSAEAAMKDWGNPAEDLIESIGSQELEDRDIAEALKKQKLREEFKKRSFNN